MGYFLVISCVFPPEPVVSASLSHDIAQRICRVAKEVVVISPRPSRPENYVFPKVFAELPFVHITIDSHVCPQSKLLGRIRESISFGRATYKYIKRHRDDIDVIYANTWPLFAQYYLAKAALKYGKPYYIHIQDIYPESYCYKMPKYLRRLFFGLLFPIDKYVLRKAKGVFAISPAMKSYLSKSRRLVDSKVILVRNWQDDKAYIDAYLPIEKKHRKTDIMYLGSINPTANVSLIIQAFSGLDKDKYHLSIIGSGPEKQHCMEIAKQLGIDASFASVTPDQVARKQSEADVLVLCLKKGVARTATPSKLTAYMFSGRPIVASVDLDSDCAKIILEAGCGIVVEPEKKDALCDAIKTITEKGIDELNNLGKSAFEYAKNHLSKESNLSLLVNTLLST